MVERSDSDFRRTVLESERMEKEYSHYFDCRIVNKDFDASYERLAQEITNLETCHQWVPVSWVF